MKIRGGFLNDQEPFFVFGDHTPVTASQARAVLKKSLLTIGLDCTNYGMHSLRIGRATDLIKYNYSVEEVQRMGRWKSNAVFKYIRDP